MTRKTVPLGWRFRTHLRMPLVMAAFYSFHAASLQAAVPGAAGDGRTDDTRAVQRAIDALGDYGTLDGGNATYLVGTLKLKSHMTFQNFALKVRPSNVPLTAPVTLDGTLRPITDVSIMNVNIDGNRAQQTNLMSAEDGGRSGFRIVGSASNIYILSSSATNCGTDGLEIFSNDVIPPSGTLNFTNIWVVDSRFENNHRHGASADSIQNVQFVRSTFNKNGLASAVSGRAPSEGESAFLVDGMLYGAGLVLENYYPQLGIKNLNVVQCTATGNARFGIQFWDPSSPTAGNFVPRSQIQIQSCTLDGGVSPTHGRQALEFNITWNYLGKGYAYQNVTLANNTVQGTIILNAVSGVRLTGGTVVSPYPGFYGTSTGSRDIVIQGVDSQGKIFEQ